MPGPNITSTRSKAFAGHQVCVEAPRPSIEALEEPEEELTPHESLERSLRSTINAAASEAAVEWALQQLERGTDPKAVLQTLVSHPIGRFSIDWGPSKDRSSQAPHLVSAVWRLHRQPPSLGGLMVSYPPGAFSPKRKGRRRCLLVGSFFLTPPPLTERRSADAL